MTLKIPWHRRARPPAPRPPTVSEGKRGAGRQQAVPLEFGDGWTVLNDVTVPGARLAITLAVGPRGTVAVATLMNRSSVAMVRGKPYYDHNPLEPALVVLLTDSRAVADVLRGPFAGKPRVHPVLVAPGAAAPFTHIDVLVVAPEGLSAALLAYAEVYTPLDVDIALSTLRGLAGHAVPRSWPNQASG